MTSKEVKAAYDREYRAKNKARIATNKRAAVLADPAKKKAADSAWVAANRERVAVYKRAWRLRNPAPKTPRVLLDPKVRAARAVARVARWRAQNPEKYAAQVASRPPRVKTAEQRARAAEYQTLRSRRLQRACPAWADKEVIELIYMVAQHVGAVVDHYYPLHGKAVCGLRVQDNLQLISFSENSRKRNKMPEAFYAS